MGQCNKRKETSEEGEVMYIYAYTDMECNYPSFVSVQGDLAGVIDLIVRSPRNADGTCGETAQAKLGPKEALELAHKLMQYVSDHIGGKLV